jgi:hypothetical protein
MDLTMRRPTDFTPTAEQLVILKALEVKFMSREAYFHFNHDGICIREVDVHPMLDTTILSVDKAMDWLEIHSIHPIRRHVVWARECWNQIQARRAQ